MLLKSKSKSTKEVETKRLAGQGCRTSCMKIEVRKQRLSSFPAYTSPSSRISSRVTRLRVPILLLHWLQSIAFGQRFTYLTCTGESVSTLCALNLSDNSDPDRVRIPSPPSIEPPPPQSCPQSNTATFRAALPIDKPYSATWSHP